LPCKPPGRRRYRRSSTPAGAGREPAVQLAGRSLSGVANLAARAARQAATARDSTTRARRRSRRNVVTAVGVRLVEAPDAPSWGEVHIRIPWGQHRAASVRVERSVLSLWRVALSETHLSGDVESLHAPTNGSPPRCSVRTRSARTAISRTPIDTGMAEFTRTLLTDQDRNDSRSGQAEMHRRPRPGDPASWKDPL
jgi:hypothetical protein